MCARELSSSFLFIHFFTFLSFARRGIFAQDSRDQAKSPLSSLAKLFARCSAFLCSLLPRRVNNVLTLRQRAKEMPVNMVVVVVVFLGSFRINTEEI